MTVVNHAYVVSLDTAYVVYGRCAVHGHGDAFIARDSVGVLAFVAGFLVDRFVGVARGEITRCIDGKVAVGNGNGTATNAICMVGATNRVKIAIAIVITCKDAVGDRDPCWCVTPAYQAAS